MPHPLFVVEPDGPVSIRDDQWWVTYEDLDKFQADEPDFALPEGYVGLNYERCNPPIGRLIKADGSFDDLEVPNDEYEAIIARIPHYRARIDERNHPLYGLSLDEAKSKAAHLLAQAVNLFIASKPDGRDRYNSALQANLLAAGMRCLREGVPVLTEITAVESWVEAVKAEYFHRKAQIKAAATIDEVKTLLAALTDEASLEAKFGVDGTAHPDPDVSSGDVAQALAAALGAS